jgi:hypothetical protein
MYKLFREATRTTKEGLVKVHITMMTSQILALTLPTHLQDLSYLNRDLSKVIAIDTDPAKYALHPENAIIVPRWRADGSGGEAGGLVGLIPFLECESLHTLRMRSTN